MWLKPGDLLRVITPSGYLSELSSVEKSVEIWRSHGYRIEYADNYDGRWGYLGGKDSDRYQQLLDALQDPECRGILCSRGGYGGSRLLEYGEQNGLSFARNNINHHDQDKKFLTTPKWLIGFSDITALLWSLYPWGVQCVHGPVLTTFAEESAWSQQRLFDLVAGKQVAPIEGKGWNTGKATGYFLPGNLTVATHLLATKYQPDFHNVILGLEDVGEAPYRIDRMLTHWRSLGILDQVAGIALGNFTDCNSTRPDYPSFTVEEVLSDRLGDLNIPIVSNLSFGHDLINLAVPVGKMVELNADQGTLTIIY
jgi:muramoyltetrapeptide carboxypeptidase